MLSSLICWSLDFSRAFCSLVQLFNAGYTNHLVLSLLLVKYHHVWLLLNIRFYHFCWQRVGSFVPFAGGTELTATTTFQLLDSCLASVLIKSHSWGEMESCPLNPLTAISTICVNRKILRKNNQPLVKKRIKFLIVYKVLKSINL